MLFSPRLLLASLVLLVTIGFTSNAFAQGDPCLEALADNPEQLDEYDALVNEYLGASAASDTATQAKLLDELIGVCDQNLKLWAFKGNVFAASDNCDGAVSAYQEVLSKAEAWPHADNAEDARKIAEDGLAKLGDKCVATVAIDCPAGASVTVDAGASQPCPANVKVTPGAHQVSVVGADGTQIHAEEYSWAAGNHTVSVQGPVAGGGGGGGGDPVPDPVPAGRADMGLELGLSGTVGFATMTLGGTLEDVEPDPGFAGGLRVFAAFRFLDWLGIGLNLGFISSSHAFEQDVTDPTEDFGLESTVSVSAIGVGLLFRLEFGGFVIAPWANFLAGTFTAEVCNGDFLGIGCIAEDESVVGFDVGTALLYSLEIFNSGYLEFGGEVGFRKGNSTEDDALDDDGGQQFYVGGTIGLMYEIGF